MIPNEMSQDIMFEIRKTIYGLVSTFTEGSSEAANFEGGRGGKHPALSDWWGCVTLLRHVNML
jgi:hypothetical protein